MTEALQLKNILESDLPLLHKWFNDPVAAGDYDGIPGNSLENLTKKFTSGRLKGMRLVEYLEEKIGWTEMKTFAEEPSSATLTVQISRPEFRGKGLGKRIHELALADFLKSHLEVKFVEVWTHAQNLPEQKILERLHFVRHPGEGRHFNINGRQEPFISYELEVKH